MPLKNKDRTVEQLEKLGAYKAAYISNNGDEPKKYENVIVVQLSTGEKIVIDSNFKQICGSTAKVPLILPNTPAKKTKG